MSDEQRHNGPHWWPQRGEWFWNVWAKERRERRERLAAQRAENSPTRVAIREMLAGAEWDHLEPAGGVELHDANPPGEYWPLEGEDLDRETPTLSELRADGYSRDEAAVIRAAALGYSDSEAFGRLPGWGDGWDEAERRAEARQARRDRARDDWEHDR